MKITTYLYQKTFLASMAKILVILILTTLLIYHAWHELNPHWIMVPYFCIGFSVGKYTCKPTHSAYGFWLTFSIFTAFNFTHSLFDGISFSTMDKTIAAASLCSHELIRQPILYAVAWTIFDPFVSGSRKILTSFFAVTIVWIIGVVSGEVWGMWMQKIEYIHDYTDPLVLLLIGDLAHHIHDELIHSREKSCQH